MALKNAKLNEERKQKTARQMAVATIPFYKEKQNKKTKIAKRNKTARD